MQKGSALPTLIEMAKILGQQTDFQELLRTVAHQSARLFEADLALVLMLNPETRETVRTIVRDGKSIEQREYRDIHIHVGGWIISKGTIFITKDIQRDKRFTRGLFDNVPAKSVAGVPLISERVIIGALILLYRNSPDLISTEFKEALENVAAIVTPFLRNAQNIRPFFEAALPDTSLLIKYREAGLHGRSPGFVELLRAVDAAARCDTRVLLVGATGTGKELVSRAIHQFSARSDGPFVAVDCGAIPQTLLESELFGHTRGAFTGAHSDRQGLFQEANSGTLFMDEINNLPFEMQSKLLRALEEREVRPVGSDKTAAVDVRIIASSSVPLKQLVEDHRFREDLYFRLHVYPVYIPNLTEREEDIPLLARHFLVQHAAKQNKKVESFHEELVDFMKERSWDGNIRELENFVERLVTVAPENTSVISAELFPQDLREELRLFREQQKHLRYLKPLKQQVDEFEAHLIKETLDACNWNQSEAARRLSTTEKNIRYKMEKLGVRRPSTE